MHPKVWLLGGILLILFLSGCTRIQSRYDAEKSNQLEGKVLTDFVQAGNYVTLYYTGTLDDNSIFDQTLPGNPATFQVGTGGLIKGFDDGLIGMKVGEKKTISIPAALAYGEFDGTKIIERPLQELIDANIPAQVGIIVQTSVGEGRITQVDENANTVTIDFNHKLAGKNLTFDVEIVKISNTP